MNFPGDNFYQDNQMKWTLLKSNIREEFKIQKQGPLDHP